MKEQLISCAIKKWHIHIHMYVCMNLYIIILHETNSPRERNKNSRALPLSHLMVGRISSTFLPCVSLSLGYWFRTKRTSSASGTQLWEKNNKISPNYLLHSNLNLQFNFIFYFDWYLFVNATKVHGQTKLVILNLSPFHRFCLLQQDLVDLQKTHGYDTCH